MRVSFVCSTVILQAEKFYFFHLVQQLGGLSIKQLSKGHRYCAPTLVLAVIIFI